MRIAKPILQLLHICLLSATVLGIVVSCSREGNGGSDSIAPVPVRLNIDNIIGKGGFPSKEMTVTAGVKTIPLPKRMNKRFITEPGILSQPDTEYLLDRDVVVDGTGFTIQASGVTLNLNGHTLTYLNKPASTSVYAIFIPGYRRKDICIANGRIVQGNGAAETKVSCPVIYDYDASNIEIGGLDLVYRTPDTSGILLHWVNNALVHDNTITDQGSVVTNRHQGVAVIEANRGGRGERHTINGNLIKGARHNGIRAGKDSEISNNEVFVDSRVTNSCGISAAGSIRHNRIIGEGVHPIGIWPGSNVTVADNYVEVQNSRRGDEYGDTGAACLRMTWGNDNVEVMNNTFILHASENFRGTGVRSWGRALWVGLPKPEQKAVFHDNLIVATNDDGKAKAAAIAVVCLNESPNLVFRHNTVISNWSNVLLADSYGHAGGYAKFVDNRFLRHDNSPGFRAIRSQYSERPSTGIFINNRFENGASSDDIDLEFSGKCVKEVAFGWHLTVSVTEQGAPSTGATVVIRDATGVKVFEGTTGKDGKAGADIVAYLITNQTKPGSMTEKVSNLLTTKGRRVSKTPHTAEVVKNGVKREKTFNLVGTADLSLQL